MRGWYSCVNCLNDESSASRIYDSLRTGMEKSFTVDRRCCNVYLCKKFIVTNFWYFVVGIRKLRGEERAGKKGREITGKKERERERVYCVYLSEDILVTHMGLSDP